MKETMKDIILNASADMTESCHKTDFIVSRRSEEHTSELQSH